MHSCVVYIRGAHKGAGRTMATLKKLVSCKLLLAVLKILLAIKT